MPLDRVHDLASTPAVTIEMAATAVLRSAICGDGRYRRAAFCNLRVGNPKVSFTPQCAGSQEAMMNPGQLDVPLAPLSVCAPQRRFGNEKGHGVLDVASGQDTKSYHRTTIGSRDAAEPDSLRSVRERLSDTTEEADAQVRVHVRELQEEL